MTSNPLDRKFLARALELAERGRGLVSPGALVGAVVVKKEKIVGEGFYQYDRRTHAEVIAIEQAGPAARGGTLFLNLEPCSHFGRTPPCADFIIQHRIQRVVCSLRDPNPLVSGAGFRKLRSAGIEVQVGSLKEEASRLNEAFLTFVRRKRPFVTLKAAMTLDGKIALANQRRGSATWITSEPSRARVHRIRHANDALLVGVNTILADDPLLTDRSGLPRRRPLLRVVLDAHLRTPLNSRLVSTAHDDVLLLCGNNASPAKRKNLEKRGVWTEACLTADHVTVWRRTLRLLAQREIQSLLIEGGGLTNASAVRSHVVDKIHFFIAPRILGGQEHISVFGGLGFSSLKTSLKIFHLSTENIGEDLLITGYTAEHRK